MIYRGRQICERHEHGFTLVELIVVVALISTFLGVVGVMYRRAGEQTAGLEAAQSILASAFTLVRGQAALSGVNGVLLVHADPDDPEKYLRYIVPAIEEADGDFHAVSDGYFLPPGCYVVPNGGPPAGATEPSEDWSAPPAIKSTALQTSGDRAIVDLTDVAETWTWLSVTPRGTTGNAGNLLVATGRIRGPGAGGAPVVFVNPDNVRGLKISAYGQFTLLESRNDL